MKIERVQGTVFHYLTSRSVDSAGHSHPGPEKRATMAMITITTDEGKCGYSFAPPEVVRPHVLEAFARKVLIGQNPFDRERLWQDLVHWQRGSAGQLTDRALAVCRAGAVGPGRPRAEDAGATSCSAASATRCRPTAAPCAAMS